ncbi:MAG: hypothetical protein BJ554DRAFT_6942 [Olpidium bornovanus]|uniref:Uncharacterized protein n=1 Tax=Olpidium bornovanus TaxID=278681 RepID=A0A8H8A256_9FUNG|nr:MAG: hypothetical protein BJ554DRAFT_6942 [Olpidium bornovanus]
MGRSQFYTSNGQLAVRWGRGFTPVVRGEVRALRRISNPPAVPLDPPSPKDGQKAGVVVARVCSSSAGKLRTKTWTVAGNMLVTISFGILFAFVCGLLFVPALFVVTVGAFHFYWNYVRPPLRPLRGHSRHTSWGVALPKLTPFTDGTSKVSSFEELAAKETIVKIGYLLVTGADELAGADGQLPAAADGTKGDAGAEGGFPDGTQGDGNRDRSAFSAPSSLFDKVALSSVTASKTLQAHLHTHFDHSAATSAASSISSFVSSKIDQMQSYIGARTKFGLNSASGGGHASFGNRNVAGSGGSAVGGGGGSGSGFIGGAAATLDKGRERSRLLNKGFLYALLRKDTLFLYDSEAQRECKGVIVLTRYMVNLYPPGQADNEVYRKDTPIRLVQRRSQMAQRKFRQARARHDVRMVNSTLAPQQRLGNSAPNSPALLPASPTTEAKSSSDSVGTSKA